MQEVAPGPQNYSDLTILKSRVPFGEPEMASLLGCWGVSIATAPASHTALWLAAVASPLFRKRPDHSACPPPPNDKQW
jgi:hypothetical protein